MSDDGPVNASGTNRQAGGHGMIEAARLRECPFCGSINVDLWRGQTVGHGRDNGMRFVRCLNCGASTAYRQKADAVSAWNERAHDDAPPWLGELVDALGWRGGTAVDAIRAVRRLVEAAREQAELRKDTQ